jgi:hypothetical protein
MTESAESPEPTKFSELEREVIILYAVWSMIDELVNFEMFELLASTENTNLMFSTATHARLFNVLLADFLSSPQKDRKRGTLPFGLPPTPREGVLSQQSYLYYLSGLCEDPKLDKRTEALANAVSSFRDWLDAECVVPEVWLAEIGVQANVRAPRLELLKICGNIGKHNFSRLEVNVRDIMRILENSGQPLTEQQAFIALPSFYEWFHRHFFVYHSSTIAEYLNNLRWALFGYLRHEFQRSFVPPAKGDIVYSFMVPEDCQQPLAREMYWGLMNHVRGKPYFPAFTVTKSLKMQY